MTLRNSFRTYTSALVLATFLALACPLDAQTQPETQPEVVFHVQMLQAERAAGDKLAGERTSKSTADFYSNETITAHILRDTSDVPSLVSGESSRNTVEVLGAPKLSTRNGREVGFLVGSRKEIPTEPDPLASGRRTLDEPAADLPERDFGLQLNLRPIVLPNGLIRVRVRPQVTSVNFADSTLRKGRYVPSLVTRQLDATYDVKPGQTIALTGLFDNQTAQQLTRSGGVANEGLLKQVLDKRTAKPNTNLVLLITPEIVEGEGK